MTAETAASAGVSVDAIDAALAAATPALGEDGQRLAVAVFRLLAAGHPVGIPAAAEAAALPAPSAASIVRSWPAVFWDDHDQVVGFGGLTAAEMPPHRIQHAGTGLSAWCAFDPLYLARIIGDLQVTTADPVTGEAITYHIGADGAITGASHPDGVLSFLRPDKPWGDDVQTTFCHYVHHFTSRSTAAQWTATHPGTFVISLDAAKELARRHTARTFGTAASA
jgi:alkylmercury lyase